ncbi:hypothetical protein [Micromonospora sp. NPDC023737]|uniref:hypothetical protein n=1 Tax=unclassified Micromonospora TaxID=2617518 RepID=UPI0033D9BFEF
MAGIVPPTGVEKHPVDQHHAVGVRLDQHVPRQDRAVHDPRPVGQAERHQQPPPHPGHVPGVQPVGVRAPHLVEVVQAGCGGEHGDPPFGAGGGIPVREVVDQPGHVRQVARVAALGDGAQGVCLAGHQVVVAGASGQLEEPVVADVVEVGQVTRVGRCAEAVVAEDGDLPGPPPGGDLDERVGGLGAYRRVGRQAVGVQGRDQLAVAPGRPVGAEQVGVGAGRRDQADRLRGPHRTVSSRAGRSSAGCSSRASPAR